MCVMKMNTQGWDSTGFTLQLGVPITYTRHSGIQGMPRRLHYCLMTAGVSATLKGTRKKHFLTKLWSVTWDRMCPVLFIWDCYCARLKCEQVTLLLKTVPNAHCWQDTAYIFLRYSGPSIIRTTFLPPLLFLPSPFPQLMLQPHSLFWGKPQPSCPRPVYQSKPNSPEQHKPLKEYTPK